LNDGTVTRSFTHDAAGNITLDDRGSDPDLGFVHDEVGRYAKLTDGGVDAYEYLYSGFGERVVKQPAGGVDPQHFHYDPAGRMLAETDGLGAAVRAYVYLDGVPVALLEPGAAAGTGDEADLDNGDAGATATGSWTTATAGQGFESSDYLLFTPTAPPGPGSGTTMDNGSGDFSSTGIWATASGSGQEGADHLSRDPTGPLPGDIIDDDADGDFSVTGNWDLRTVGGGFYGSGYRLRRRYGFIAGEESQGTIVDDGMTGYSQTVGWGGVGNQPTAYGTVHQTASGSSAVLAIDPADIIDDDDPTSRGTVIDNNPWGNPADVIDNRDAGFALPDGEWRRWNWSTERWADDGLVALADTVVSARAEWTPTIGASASYRVYAWWHTHSSHANAAPYTIHHAGGSSTVSVNQRINGKRWNLLGTYTMDPGQNHRVELTNLNAGGTVVADAVAVLPPGVDAPAPAATWDLEVATAGNYRLYARWVSWTNRATNASYEITHAGGTTTVVWDQTGSGGAWNALGLYTLTPGQGHKITLSGHGNGGLSADAVLILSDDVGPSPTATFNPAVTTAGTYDLYGYWWADTDRATDTPYTIASMTGPQTFLANQQLNHDQWVLLGRTTLAAGSNTLTVTDRADGVVVADAVKLTAATDVAATAAWAFTPGQSGNHTIYAKWVEGPANATNSGLQTPHPRKRISKEFVRSVPD
jgi:hypothetical protein